MTKEQILKALKMALERNRYTIGETRMTILPTEIAVEIYNYLSEKEKLVLVT